MARIRVGSRFPRVEGVESEPWEARRGPNKGQLGPKLAKIYKAKNYINLEPLYIGPLIAIWIETGFLRVEGVKPEARRGPRRAK